MIDYEGLVKHYVTEYKPKIETGFNLDLKDIQFKILKDKKEAPNSNSFQLNYT